MSLEKINTDKGLAASRHLADKRIFLGVIFLVSPVYTVSGNSAFNGSRLTSGAPRGCKTDGPLARFPAEVTEMHSVDVDTSTCDEMRYHSGGPCTGSHIHRRAGRGINSK